MELQQRLWPFLTLIGNTPLFFSARDSEQAAHLLSAFGRTLLKLVKLPGSQANAGSALPSCLSEGLESLLSAPRGSRLLETSRGGSFDTNLKSCGHHRPHAWLRTPTEHDNALHSILAACAKHLSSLSRTVGLSDTTKTK